MNDMPLHPAIVHLPLGLAMIIPVIALVVAIGVHREKLPRWAWALPFALQLSMVLSGLVAMQTGEQDEERVEEVVAEHAIEEHEEAAEAFVRVAGALSVVFLLGVALPKPSWRAAAMAVSTVGSVAVTVLALGVGHAGGELVYQHGAASAYAAEARVPPGGLPGGHYEEDDDD